MLRWARAFTTGYLGSTNSGLTICAGLAGTTTLHTFALTCFASMLLSPLSFLARLAGCPRRSFALNLLPLRGYLPGADAAHPIDSGPHTHPGFGSSASSVVHDRVPRLGRRCSLSRLTPASRRCRAYTRLRERRAYWQVRTSVS